MRSPSQFFNADVAILSSPSRQIPDYPEKSGISNSQGEFIHQEYGIYDRSLSSNWQSWVYRSYYADLSLICSGILAEQRFQLKIHSCQLETTANPCLAGFSS
jgi:hypothetical protein